LDIAALRAAIGAEALQPVAAEAQTAADILRTRYGTGVGAIVFYGSCLREGAADGLLDFYVLVERYRPALGPFSAIWAMLLPPNVYYHEFEHRGRCVRVKVAVMRLDQFLRGLSERCFSSMLSARFAQPAAIVFARDDRVRAALVDGFCASVATTVARTAPLLEDAFTARALWSRALAESFAAELRPETRARREAFIAGDLDRYEAVTAAVLGQAHDGRFANPAANPQGARRAQGKTLNALRRVQGKTLNALRLIKAAFTFRGGLDYAAWKIRRHSGVDIALTAHDRARPLAAGLRLFVVALKRGGIR
jgi:hypothetical protein